MDWVEMDPHEVSGFTDPTADKDAHAEPVNAPIYCTRNKSLCKKCMYDATS